MSDEKDQPQQDTENDDVYVIDDTGESLEEFNAGMDVSEEQKPRETAQAAGGGDAVEQLRKENQSLRDQLLRSRADFDNFRKRVEKEKADHLKYALAHTVRELLPIVDNFERALSHDSSAAEFHTGIEMIYKQMSDVLQKLGVREVDAENAMFDPTVHEAVMREERTDVPSHRVLQVLQKGYTLNDRLIRPAMVKVAVGGPEHHDEGQA